MGVYKLDACKRHHIEQSESESELSLKIAEFQIGIEKYTNNSLYFRLELMVSVLIMLLQAVSFFNLYRSYNGPGAIEILFAFIGAYIITDFVNGIIHMYMDNNTDYTSIVGPFVSAFHLHHAKPKYIKRHPIKVYFYESGTKFWLLGYLFVLCGLQYGCVIPCALNICLVSFAVLSSVAEVSHYWCHNATKKNKIIQILQKCRILLSKKHHINHHRNDNTHYAFLNGMTDPLLNQISHYLYAGYKNNADKHISAYVKAKTLKHSE